MSSTVSPFGGFPPSLGFDNQNLPVAGVSGPFSNSEADVTDNEETELLNASWNQDYGCFAAGTSRGFRIYNCDPFKETFRRDMKNGGFGIVEMLFRCNILALVGGKENTQYPPNKVIIWDDHESRCIGEFTFRSEVRAVKLRRDRVVVVLEHKVYVYNFMDLKLLHQIETLANPKGLCCLSHHSNTSVLACPGIRRGQVRIEHFGLHMTKLIHAHDAQIACMTLTMDGLLLATASTKGTLVRIFNTMDGTRLQEVVTDNGANFKAAGGLLSRRIPTLYWTPCAAHCLDLMLEDICKLKEFVSTITHGRGLTTFVYRHGRLLAAMRELTQGRDIVRPGATRFATAFLTLQSINRNQDALRKLFGSPDWFNSKLSKTVAGQKVHDVVLSTKFWKTIEDCLLASLPLLQVLRVVDGDEKPAMAELCAAMDFAKKKMKEGLEKKQRLLKKVLRIVERRWECQMEVDLYGAALFLNPGKFFDIKENDYAYSSQLRMKFNDVLEKLVVDPSLVEKISNQADQYENSRNAFGKQLSIRQRKSKNPLDWWGAFGGLTLELAMFTKRIIGLCCSSSGCERNWSTFEFVRRGVDRADVYSIALSPNVQWLAVSSDKGTVHIFSLRVRGAGEDTSFQTSAIKSPAFIRQNSSSSLDALISPSTGANPGSSLSFMKGVLPKYFSSEWSFAQFHISECTHFIAAFGSQNTLVIVSVDGSFYRCSFDPVNGGEMIQQEYVRFLKNENRQR